jgi:hypothetical protein
MRRHRPVEWLRKTPVAAAFSPEKLGLLEGIPLLRAANTPESIRQAHRVGARAITYVSVMDTFIDGSGHQRLPFKKELAPILCLDERGRFINTPMDNSWRMTRFLVCNNNPLYVEQALGFVETMLDMGGDGLFIDNVGCPEECHGEGLHVGFSRYGDIAAQIPGTELFDPAIAELPVHEHIYPDRSHKYAHKRLLGRIWDVVKSRDSDNVCILNLGTELDEFGFGEEADGIMLESYIYSWAWKGRNLDFQQIREWADYYAPYIASGGSVYALPYPRDPATRDEDHCFAYAAARLSGFFCETVPQSEQDPVLRLARADPGDPVGETCWLADHAYRLYQRGVVALNGSDQPKSIAVELPSTCPNRLTDLFTGRPVRCDGIARLELPPQSGRAWVAATG